MKLCHSFRLAVLILFGLGFAQFLAAAEPPVRICENRPPVHGGPHLPPNVVQIDASDTRDEVLGAKLG